MVNRMRPHDIAVYLYNSMNELKKWAVYPEEPYQDIMVRLGLNDSDMVSENLQEIIRIKRIKSITNNND